MKNKFRAFLTRKKDNELYTMMFNKYYDSLNNGLSEEESYNQAISITADC